MSEQEPSRTLPRTGRLLAWLGVLGMMVGLTAFYQLLMPSSGGLVHSVTEGATVRIELQRDRSGHYRVPGEINGHEVAFLVDTGATDVALSERAALRARAGDARLLAGDELVPALRARSLPVELAGAGLIACSLFIMIGLLASPNAMAEVMPVRRELGVRTIFNLLGPLTNPAGAPNQVLGVFSAQWLEPLATVLGKLGSEHVLVVHADDGLDEISIGSATQVAELKQGKVDCYRITPEQFGLQTGDVRSLAVASPQESLAMIRAVLDDTPGAARDIVLLNAGAAIYVCGIADSLQHGVDAATRVIASGEAKRKLEQLIDTSNGF